MVVKSQIKLIRSLQHKKNRSSEGLFIVEGEKGIKEAIANGLVPYLLCTSLAAKATVTRSELIAYEKVSAQEMSQMSALKNPNGYLGVFRVPKTPALDFSNWILALDGLQDPGNLGTIIRLCDWFGVRHILCSENTVDAYNPKVIQATMGSIGRVHLHYVDLAASLAAAPLEVVGTFMDGQSISSSKFDIPGILVMGNEGQGISKEIAALVSQKVSIPAHQTAATESLNVASAAGIALYEIRRSTS